MPNKSQSQRNSRNIILIFLLTAFAITMTGYLYYANQKKHFKQEKYHELTAIGDLKVNEILRWKQERKDDATLIMESPFIARNFKELLTNPASAGSRDLILAQTEFVRKNYQNNSATKTPIHLCWHN